MINLSIVNDEILAKDFSEPFTFLQWLNQSTTVDPDVNVQFNNYKNYILSWTEKKALSRKESQKTLQAAYIQVLREIVITYSTEEEKRFIVNADLTNPSDIEIILPFFINRLKQICLFYTITREKLKYTAIEYNIRGTNFSIEKAVKDLIFSTARLDLSFDNLPCFFPPISAIAQDLSVYVEEVYDTTSDYFNKSIPDRQSYVTTLQNISSVNLIYPQLYTDFNHAILDAINQYPFFIDNLNIFSVNPVLSGTELNYLKNRDFIDYVNNGLAENLKINLLKRLAPKFLANDFYFLSTGNTSTDIVSGVLFTVSPLTGAPTLNLLNKTSPTVATVPSLENLYTSYELGRFFLPQHLGVLTYAAPQKKYIINTKKLLPNTVYAFPDPTVIGNISFNSLNDEPLVPMSYIVDVTWNKTSRSNQFKFGDVFATPYNSFYYGYQSREQDLNISTSGISRVQDNIDFWKGIYSDSWKNADIWPGIDIASIYPTQAKQDSLLVNTGVPVYWSSDIYNNDFCLIKDVDSLKTISTPLTSEGVIPGQSNILSKRLTYLQEKSIFEKKYTAVGSLYYRDNILGIVISGYDALSSVILRYPPAILSDIKNCTHYFAVYGNTFVIETSGHVVVDNFEYNFKTNKIKATSPQGLIFAKTNNNERIERFAGEWFSEKNHVLYLCFITVDKLNSKSNYKTIHPVIYEATLAPLQSRLTYPSKETNLFDTYSLSGSLLQPPQINITDIEGVSFEFLNRTNIFNLTYLGKNLNSLPFLVNEQIYKNEPFYYTYKPQLFQPFYFIVDNNYYTPSLPYFVKYVGSNTGIIGSHLLIDGRFYTSNFNLSNLNYAYCDGAKPLQLNTLGSYIVQFDWQTYNEVTMFIGCSGYIVRNVDNFLLWDAYKPSARYLFTDIPITSYQEKLSSLNGATRTIPITSVITRLTEDATLVKFDLISDINGFTTPICDNPDNIYRKITITKAGAGRGQVISDPFCIDCNDKCSEDFGINTTVTFIASADYFSFFERWAGGQCENLNTDCIFTVTTAVNLTAYFGKVTVFDLLLRTPAGEVFSQDGRVRVSAGDGSNGPASVTVPYPVNTIITLSAFYPLSGWVMYGYDGGRCTGVQGLRCTFAINADMEILARYVRFYEYPLRVNISSFVPSQSAAADSIAVGADNVDDGFKSANKFFYTYLCNNPTCTFILTGTNTERYGNQTATLCARPAPGRKLKYWIGDTACESAEYTNAILTTIPADIANTGYTCELTMDTYREATAVFDTGYYTLTIVATGDGIGHVYSQTPDPFFKSLIEGPELTGEEAEKVIPNSVNYSILSGTTITVYASALRGNTFQWLSSISCPVQNPTLSTCQITMNENKVLLVSLSAFAFYDFIIVNKSTCNVMVCAFPAGRFNTVIACSGIGPGEPGCYTTYKSGRIVSLVAENTTKCSTTGALSGVQYYEASPVDGGGGLKYQYKAGDGIYLSLMSKPEPQGEIFSIIDGSIKLGAGGLPYISGTGITVEPKAFVEMTDNITITAFPL